MQAIVSKNWVTGNIRFFLLRQVVQHTFDDAVYHRFRPRMAGIVVRDTCFSQRLCSPIKTDMGDVEVCTRVSDKVIVNWGHV